MDWFLCNRDLRHERAKVLVKRRKDIKREGQFSNYTPR